MSQIDSGQITIFHQPGCPWSTGHHTPQMWEQGLVGLIWTSSRKSSKSWLNSENLYVTNIYAYLDTPWWFKQQNPLPLDRQNYQKLIWQIYDICFDPPNWSPTGSRFCTSNVANFHRLGIQGANRGLQGSGYIMHRQQRGGNLIQWALRKMVGLWSEIREVDLSMSE